MRDRSISRDGRWHWQVVATVASLSCFGCNPNLDIDGALLPAWIIAGIVGVAFTVAARGVLLKTGVDRHLLVRPAVYLALAITFTCVTWLTLFRF